MDEIMKEEPETDHPSRPRKKRKDAAMIPKFRPETAPEENLPLALETPLATVSSSQTIEEEPKQPPQITAMAFALKWKDMYAGEHTQELEERHKAFTGSFSPITYTGKLSANSTPVPDLASNTEATAGDAAHDDFCLVCWDTALPLKICNTCPRAYHTTCLRPGTFSVFQAEGETIEHCPLCVKRTWNIKAPQQNPQSASIFAAEKKIGLLIRVFLRTPAIASWIELHDDGSIGSDHRLVKDLGDVDLTKWVDVE